jgi:hypothetical protein
MSLGIILVGRIVILRETTSQSSCRSLYIACQCLVVEGVVLLQFHAQANTTRLTGETSASFHSL